MNAVSKPSTSLAIMAMYAASVPGVALAQEQAQSQDSTTEEVAAESDILTTVDGARFTAGPEIEGVIAATGDNSIEVVSEDGSRSMIYVDETTAIKATGGFLGLGRRELSVVSLLNGLPVEVETMQSGNILLASEIKFKNKDLETAAMIRNATDQRFSQQSARINENKGATEENAAQAARNAAAAEALRGRLGDIDKYNVKNTVNVYFDTNKSSLSAESRANLCAIASEADQIDNSLMLVVGYTDSTGSYEVNQRLSEARAARVVNFLQQNCSWAPYRMLTPTGMAAADPAASNATAEGKAQNRRVSVNILVSKALEGG